MILSTMITKIQNTAPKTPTVYKYDQEEPKVQKLLNWTDFGPFRCLEEKAIASAVKSLAQIEVFSISSL